ncbi:MAG: protein kinase [Terriglobia bacterium]|jgi:serine/threonine-protein kinase
MSFEVGDTVGDYQIIGLLGAGGMGKVYKAKNTISDRIDALKVLLPNLADDQELADRFTREIKVLASLNHPNIAGLRTAFRVDNQLLMVMEFVEGTTLDEKIKAGPISVEDAIGYITQVLAALGYAHKHGVIHRDIKPANMMLTTDNVIKLMDFGIAKTKNDRKLTQTGATLGSLFYMSAEQVQGNELDGRSDLYSVGVSLYEMVTGTRPFKGNSDFDIMIAQIQQTPMPPIEMMPDLPKALNDIIVISLEKDPAKRFQTAEAFSAALGSITHALNATPVQASTGLMPTVAAPAPMQPVAVGGTVSAPRISTTYQPTGMAPQPEAPVVTPPDPSHGIPSPSRSKGYRGLYMTLGALIALAVIVLAATQLPRIMKTQASSDQTAQVSTPATTKSGAPNDSTANTGSPQGAGAASSSTSSTSPTSDATVPNGGPAAGNVSNPPAESAGSTSASSGLPSTENPANRGGHTTRTANKSAMNQATAPSSTGGGGAADSPLPPGGPGQVAQPPAESKGASPQELAELAELHDKLSVRAQTENSDVESLRKQMAAGGNNLRSDISAAQTRMNMDMNKFDAAMNAGDPEAAKKYMSMAEREVETLEKFFGH